ncbi:CLUMA_CG018835, isoform A [Clunio marinus]|uniref:CLUMA_CG018835, isoform A n=1 Tax=Clunio marinus TaxID=568069 RepID=A0A1J1J0E8_9DIPT|nr:CLUMA_CG018835, isoform A [Clunio marinus]
MKRRNYEMFERSGKFKVRETTSGIKHKWNNIHQFGENEKF